MDSGSDAPDRAWIEYTVREETGENINYNTQTGVWTNRSGHDNVTQQTNSPYYYEENNAYHSVKNTWEDIDAWADYYYSPYVWNTRVPANPDTNDQYALYFWRSVKAKYHGIRSKYQYKEGSRVGRVIINVTIYGT